MIKKAINKTNLNVDSIKADLEYWLSKSPDERIEAVELLRRHLNGNTARLQRTVKVIQRT